MSKDFLDGSQLRNNSLKLAHEIHTSGFVPDVIYCSLRGGIYLANVISEYFKIVRKGKRPVFYAAVVAHSYSDIRQNEAIRVDGWTYSPEHLRSGDRILLIDDIFDSGKTINHLAQIIMSKGVPRKDLKIAVHDYKIRTFQEEELPIHPDYYCFKHVITDPSEDNWIHYAQHELIGLTADEIKKHYLTQDPELEEVFKTLGML